MVKIAAVVGTRPQFIEMAPIIHELKRQMPKDWQLSIYNTEQHYDENMSKVFMNQLSIPEPTHVMDIAYRGQYKSQNAQMARILTEGDKILDEDKPDALVVEGDTTTAFGMALVASRKHIKVFHVESGGRSGDTRLPEEMNRKLLADLASVHYAPTQNHVKNLVVEGIESSQIEMLGHPVVDSIELVRPLLIRRGDDIKIADLPLIRDSTGISSRRVGSDNLPDSLHSREYYFVTLHRDHNVDDANRLGLILQQLNDAAVTGGPRIIFAIHPRTMSRIVEFGHQDLLKNIICIEPVGYILSLSLISNARCVITDSGGLIKEASILGTPMITVRPVIEMIETLRGVANQLAFSSERQLEPDIKGCIYILEDNYKRALKDVAHIQSFLGKPGVSSKIAANIIRRIQSEIC